MNRPWNLDPGDLPVRPSPAAVLAVVESVVCGLVARHAGEEASPAVLFLVPVAVGYWTVASSDERHVGLLTPPAALLMMLGAGIAEGWGGVIFVLVLMPVFMLLALLGGALASLVRGICRSAFAHRGTAHPGRGLPARHRRGRTHSPAALSRTGTDRRPAADPRDAWQQIIIRTPL